jgi:hypothetical protein
MFIVRLVGSDRGPVHLRGYNFDARRLIGHRKPDLADRINPSRLLADQSRYAQATKIDSLFEQRGASFRDKSGPSGRTSHPVRSCRVAAG